MCEPCSQHAINYFLQLKIYYAYISNKVTMSSQQESAIQEEFKRLGNIKVPLKTYDEIYEEIFLRRAKRATQEEFKRLGSIETIGNSDYFVERYLESKKIQQFCRDFLFAIGEGHIMHLEPRDLSPLTNYLFVFLDEFEGIYYYNEDDWYDKLLSVMRVCIRYANLETKTFSNNNPLLLLNIIKHKLAGYWFSTFSLFYDFEMHTFTLKNSPNIKGVLRTFPRISSIEISNEWHKRDNMNKRKNAAIKIQQKVVQWLYRPEGNFMKKAEVHFYKTAATVCG